MGVQSDLRGMAVKTGVDVDMPKRFANFIGRNSCGVQEERVI